MNIKHPRIKSPVFKLISIHELDIEFEVPNDKIDRFTLRIELFVSTNDSRLFRFRAYRTERYDLRPTFPVIGDVNDEDNIASVNLFVDQHGLTQMPEIEEFKADSPDHALQIIIDYLGKALKYITSIDIVRQ